MFTNTIAHVTTIKEGNFMYSSDSFGRIFWVDDNLDFKSCPLCVNGTGDFDVEDYVSEWTDWEGVTMDLLFDIHQSCIVNKINHANSLTIKGGR
jgi:hypothetical protein